MNIIRMEEPAAPGLAPMGLALAGAGDRLVRCIGADAAIGAMNAADSRREQPLAGVLKQALSQATDRMELRDRARTIECKLPSVEATPSTLDLDEPGSAKPAPAVADAELRVLAKAESPLARRH